MLKLNSSSRFKKDYKLCARRGYDLNLLQNVVNTLRSVFRRRFRQRTRTTDFPENMLAVKNVMYSPTGC